MSDRFPLLAVAQASPGQCFACGTPSGPFVDTGKTTEELYTVILCRSCVLEMAETFGASRPERVETEAALRRNLEEQVVALTQRVTGLQTVADAVRNAWVWLEEGDGVPAGDAGDGGGDAGRGRGRGADRRAADGGGGGKVRTAGGAAQR